MFCGSSERRVDAAPLLRARLGVVEDIRQRRGRAARALRVAWYGHGSGFVCDRPSLRFETGGPVRRRPRRLESFACLVFAGGAVVRPPRVPKRAVRARLRVCPAATDAASVHVVGGRGLLRAPDPLLRGLHHRCRSSLAPDRSPSLPGHLDSCSSYSRGRVGTPPARPTSGEQRPDLVDRGPAAARPPPPDGDAVRHRRVRTTAPRCDPDRPCRSRPCHRRPRLVHGSVFSLGGVAVLAPFALASTRFDKFFGAWVLLAIGLATVFASRRAGHVGLVLVTAACAIELGSLPTSCFARHSNVTTGDLPPRRLTCAPVRWQS
jgi:hypothetical protein